MDWKSHAAIAFVVTLSVFYFLVKITDPLPLLVLAIFSAISAFIPDIDHEMGKGRQMLNRLVPLLALFVIYTHVCPDLQTCISDSQKFNTLITLSLALVGIYFILFTYLKPAHRGITHSLFACLVYSVLIYPVLGFQLSVSGFIGYMSHLIADKEIKII